MKTKQSLFSLGATTLFLTIAFLVPITAIGHGGGLDSDGCHTQSSTGEYHCHGGGFKSKSKTSGNDSDAYDRDTYGGWRDLDSDCQDMREEILIDEAEQFSLSNSGCWVERGFWDGPYTGKPLTDRSKIHIDHLVPLAEAHKSGAASWPREKKQAFANDRENLIAVEGSANMSKGARDPAEWMPEQYRCKYIERWVQIKNKYELSSDKAEREAIKETYTSCY